MALRYARVDVDFFHKRTSKKLQAELGLGGPLVFLALILKAKDGVVPGTFTYPSEAVAWEKLGFDGVDVGFTIDEFLTVTGRMKQTSRTPVGQLMNVRLTHYGDWQKDAKRYEEAVKKARIRATSAGDTNGTPPGTAEGHNRGPSSRTTSTPKPPRGKSKTALSCPHCGASQRTQSELDDHLEYVHPPQAEPALAHDDDIPF